ncbi:hypothetical protein K7X08_011893 [Anisodus acutangulus]|uniref:Jacalin-type lectin domain-containing protein n=1 Tax=Anisodus acutangulus TaxID=402998 RepID=A0A9Q1LD28_9SOLA|nr:hypothetical protein K7X08_011893 [Anisodus acutangulus]
MVGVQRIVKDPAPYGPGSWGGEGGKPWDDGVFTVIKQIILIQSSEAICFIEIEYDRNGPSVWSVRHGANVGKFTNRVKLQYPHEVLTCITGFYGPISKDMGLKVIKSLTFHTTRRKFGPFGEELGTYFTSSTTEGKVVGWEEWNVFGCNWSAYATLVGQSENLKAFSYENVPLKIDILLF